MYLPRFVVALSCLLIFSAANAEEQKPSYYLIGNSLTWDTVPSKLDGDVQWHVDCGKSLPFIEANPEKPCVKSSKLWPEALKSKQYDFVSVQPHYGSTLEQDVKVISQWVKSQPKAVFIIHSGWSRQPTRAEEYQSKAKSGALAHSPAYFNAIVAELSEQFPDREFRQTHAIDLLQKIDDDIQAGKAPIKELAELHRDVVHMNVVTGRYLMHNAMRNALGQPRSQKGFEKLSEPMQTYLNSVLDTLPKP